MFDYIKNLFKPSKVSPYKIGDFIITKTYQKKGEVRGGLIFRIENYDGENYEGSLGSFREIENKVKWIPKNYVTLLIKNIDRKLSAMEVEELLPDIVEKSKF